MFWVDIMISFGPMCVVTSAIARLTPYSSLHILDFKNLYGLNFNMTSH